jgi:hypothetical protein
MTLVLAWNLHDFVLVAADTRVTWHHQDGTIEEDDTQQKIFEVPLGLVAGSGITLLLNPLLAVVSSARRREVARLPRLLREAETEARKSLPAHDPSAAAYAQRTGVFVASGARELSLSLYHSEDNYEPIEVRRGLPGSLLPIDVRADATADFEQEIATRGRNLTRFRSVDDSLDYHMALVAWYFHKVQSVSQVLSPTIQFGMLLRGGETGVSEILQLADFSSEISTQPPTAGSTLPVRNRSGH